MIAQSAFMVLAAIVPDREDELRKLLESMNAAPGRVDPDNPLIPFGQCEKLHFARLLILKDRSLTDVGAYGLETRTYPFYLAFLGDVDGDADLVLTELAKLAPAGLRSIFSCCEGFTADSDLDSWMKSHGAPSIANYVNWRGRTVRRIREEFALREAVHSYVIEQGATLAALAPRELHSRLRQFMIAELSAGRITLSPEEPTSTSWSVRNLLHLVGLPLLALLASPLLIVIAPFYLIHLRELEKSDPELWYRDDEFSDGLSLLEDHDVTNQFSVMGSMKPGLFRLATMIGVLSVVNYTARHVYNRGRLARIRTIHFARWVFLDGRTRMAFFSNYDGTVESYMDDFINKAGFGLNPVFSNGIGYPTTNWLVLDGCSNEGKYKDFLRRHTMPTQVWYKAYPGLTAIDLDRNGRLRRGLESPLMSEEETREWTALL
jgi:hypothetical protein